MVKGSPLSMRRPSFASNRRKPTTLSIDVDSLVADDEFDDEIVKVGRVRRPRLQPGKGERGLESIRSEMIDQARDRRRRRATV